MLCNVFFLSLIHISKSHVYSEREDLMLHRDGKVLTTKERRFFDMSNPDAIAYLTDKVIGQLKKYNFDYMKMDYNDTIGIGLSLIHISVNL